MAANLAQRYQKQWVNPNDQGRNAKSTPKLVQSKSYDDSAPALTDYIDPGEKVESLTTVNFGDLAPVEKPQSAIQTNDQDLAPVDISSRHYMDEEPSKAQPWSPNLS